MPAVPDNASTVTVTAPLPVLGSAGGRRPDEMARAFHAFCHYRDLPSFSRSIDAAWAEHVRECTRHQKGNKRATGNWVAGVQRTPWPARAAGHDDDLARRRRARRAAELEQAQDDIAEIARAGLDRIAERLRGMESDELPLNVLHSWLKVFAEVLLRGLGDDKRGVEGQGEVDLLVYIRNRAEADGIDPDAAVAEAERMLGR